MDRAKQPKARRVQRAIIGGLICGGGSTAGRAIGHWIGVASLPPHAPTDMYDFVGGLLGTAIFLGLWILGQEFRERRACGKTGKEALLDGRVWPPAPRRSDEA